MNIKSLLSTASIMAIFAGAAALVLWLVASKASPLLAQHEQEKLLAQLNSLIPADTYDNDLLQDRIIENVPSLDAKHPITIFRARKQQQPIASILTVTAPNGYSGDIRLLVAVWATGKIAGVRILSHKETPGLGDYIEDKRSPWVQQFEGKSLQSPSRERWKVKKDGGVFTYNTGATITPRAVVAVLAKTLDWLTAEGDAVYRPSDREGQQK